MSKWSLSLTVGDGGCGIDFLSMSGGGHSWYWEDGWIGKVYLEETSIINRKYTACLTLTIRFDIATWGNYMLHVPSIDSELMRIYDICHRLGVKPDKV